MLDVATNKMVGLNVKIEESWKRQIADEWKQPYFNELVHFLREEKANKEIIF
jgi:uracil DNA glycosylase